MEHNIHLYKKGFNAGYIIAEHKPDLMSKIKPHLSPSNEFLDGFIEGSNELEKRKSKKLIAEMKSIRVTRKSKENDLERE